MSIPGNTDDVRGLTRDIGLRSLAELMLQYQAVKDAKYQGNWARRGWFGWFYGCVTRQTDRLEPLFNRLTSHREQFERNTSVAEDFMDTLLDGAVFLLLGLKMMAVYHPKAYDNFLDRLNEEIEDGKDIIGDVSAS